jgi:hypothetical protein
MKFRQVFKESIYTDIKNYDGSESDYKKLETWINSLNWSGRVPVGMKHQYQMLKAVKGSIDQRTKFDIKEVMKKQDVNMFLRDVSAEDLEKLNAKMSKDAQGDKTEIKTSFATYFNKSPMAYSKFQKAVKDIDDVLSKLKGYHAKILKNLKVEFSDAKTMKAKAKYKQSEDAIVVKHSAITSGTEYASLSYIIVHELGHRYLKQIGVSFDHDDRKWITTPYSKTDSMTGEEKFAELFALSHFNYSGNFFNPFKEKIEEFKNIMISNKDEMKAEIPDHLKRLFKKDIK